MSSEEEKLREELARRIEELQVLQAQYEVLKNSLDTLISLLNETRIVREELGKIEEIKEENEVLIPLGSRVLIHAKVMEKPTILYALGSGILASLPLDEVRKKLSEEEKRISEDIAKLQKDLAELVRRIAITQELARKIQGKLVKATQSKK